MATVHEPATMTGCVQCPNLLLHVVDKRWCIGWNVTAVYLCGLSAVKRSTLCVYSFSANIMSILLTYACTIVLAVAPIYFGSFAGLRRQAGASKEEQEMEPMSASDAAKFPVFGSALLCVLFLAFKYVPKAYVNLVVTVYFSCIGFIGLKHLLTSAPIIHKYVPVYWRKDKNPFTIVISRGQQGRPTVFLE
jgi:hypothetical protein